MTDLNKVAGMYTREFQYFLDLSDVSEIDRVAGGGLQVRNEDELHTAPRQQLYQRRSTAENVQTAPGDLRQDDGRIAQPTETADDIIRRLREENAALKQSQLDSTLAENSEMRERIKVLENSLNQNNSFSFNFREVKDTITPFSGERNEDVDTWIVDMENIAVAMRWSEQQLYIYGKNNLRGTARLAMSGKVQVSNWLSLKKCLRDEFQREVSLLDVHQTMISRKWRKEETLLHYYY